MKLDKRRRIEFKTDYRKRLKMLEGGFLRLVIRKTNRYIIMQIVESRNSQDKIIHNVNSKELLKLGWPEKKKNSLKTITAAYLAGMLLSKKAKDLKENLILDSGLVPNTKGSRVYAALKGALDGGLKINHEEKVMPSKERIEGKENGLDEIFNKVKGGLEKHEKTTRKK